MTVEGKVFQTNYNQELPLTTFEKKNHLKMNFIKRGYNLKWKKPEAESTNE